MTEPREHIEHQIGKWHTVVYPTEFRGYFEHDDYGEGGGLWFEDVDESTFLVDYDGVFELPREVCEAIEHMGYYVEDICWPDETRSKCD